MIRAEPWSIRAVASSDRHGGSNAGVGYFAIPIDVAAEVMGQLVDNGKVVRGYIGHYVSDIRDGLAESFGYERAGGALVQIVSFETVAEHSALGAARRERAREPSAREISA
jgi:S1-C subfamily serine protease